MITLNTKDADYIASLLRGYLLQLTKSIADEKKRLLLIKNEADSLLREYDSEDNRKEYESFMQIYKTTLENTETIGQQTIKNWEKALELMYTGSYQGD